MKKNLLLLFVFTCLVSFGQSYNDTIYLKSGDIIKCQIITDTEQKIYYNAIINDLYTSDYIDKSDVARYSKQKKSEISSTSNLVQNENVKNESSQQISDSIATTNYKHEIGIDATFILKSALFITNYYPYSYYDSLSVFSLYNDHRFSRN